jgi:hypothetical protein
MRKVKIISIFLFFTILISCTKDSKTSIHQIWRFKANNKQYQWKGDSKEISSWGSSTYSTENSVPELELWQLEDEVLSFKMTPISLNEGKYILNNYDAVYTLYGIVLGYTTDEDNYITLNITENNNNLIKGTFSGEMFRTNNQGKRVVLKIDNGYFEAVEKKE